MPTDTRIWEEISEHSWDGYRAAITRVQQHDIHGIDAGHLERWRSAADSAEADGHRLPNSPLATLKLLSRYQRS